MEKASYHKTAAREDLHWCLYVWNIFGEKLLFNYLNQDDEAVRDPHALWSGRLRISGEI